jgi:hypothetical protein
MRCLSLSVLLSFAALSTGLGCGSSNSKEADASIPDLAPGTPDLRPATVDSSAPDAWLSPDSATDSLAIPDVNVVPDASVTSDLQISPDLSSPDLGAAGADRSAADLGVADLGGAETGDKDTGGAEVGGDVAGSADAARPPDVANPPDVASPADAAFDPGPTEPIVVNSGNTATYNLGDGTWKRFSFSVEAGQIYAISDLSGIVRGYVSAQATVSPTSFTYQTSAGTVIFTASTAGTYYIAVAVVGGGASGSFQVADGGRPLALGATSLTLTAPSAEDFYFFRFPVSISSGKGYHLVVEGPVQPGVALSVSERAERASSGGFSFPVVGISGSLPLDYYIEATKVPKSLSGFYYFYLNVHGDMTLTVTISEFP